MFQNDAKILGLVPIAIGMEQFSLRELTTPDWLRPKGARQLTPPKNPACAGQAGGELLCLVPK